MSLFRTRSTAAVLPVAAAMLVVAAALISSNAFAQTPATAATPDETAEPLRVEPVTVTARKWTEQARDVPQSVSVIDEATLRDAGITSVREASFYVPNLHLTEFSSRRLSFPTVRGISTGVGDPSVTTYVDGVPQLSVSSTNVSLLDVERIEFLRGPQGTLYGRNSIGGLIKLETAPPGNALGVRWRSTFGSDALQDHSLAVSGPLVEGRLSGSLSGQYAARDGYTTNQATGNPIDDREALFGRAKARYAFDDANVLELTAYGERARDGGFALGPLEGLRRDPHRIAVDFEGSVDRDIGSVALTWEHSGERLDVTSVSSFVDWEVSEEADFDFSPADAVRRFTDESETYFYQELRAATPDEAPIRVAHAARLRLLLGGTFFSSSGDESATNAFGAFAPPPLAPGDTTTDRGELDDLGVAVFGQAMLQLGESVDLTAGLRYDHERKEADITNEAVLGGFPLPPSRRTEDRSFDELVPAFSIAARPHDDVLLYASAARGFKAGGFNLSAPEGDGSFDTESSWTYEAGVKAGWGDDRVTLEAAYFYVDWDDLQLTLFDAASGGYIDNAGGATSQGLEIQSVARPLAGLELFGGVGFTAAKFDSFVDPFGEDVSGNDLPFVPGTTVNVGAQYAGRLGPDIRWFVRGEYVDVGSYALDAGNRESERFGLAHFRVGAEWRGLGIAGWIRNAFDDDYVLVALQPDPSDPTRFVGENGAPQTFGLTLTYRL